MYRKLILSTIVLAIVSSCKEKKHYTAEEIAANSQKVIEYLDKRFDESIARNPEFAGYIGLKLNNDKWGDRSENQWHIEAAASRETLDSLKKIDTAGINESARLSIRLYEENVNHLAEDSLWLNHGYWISQMGGEHNDIPSFLINIHQIDSLPDAEAYISRLTGIPKVFEQVLAQLKKREALGMIPPKFTFHYVTDDVKNFIAGLDKTDASNILYTDFSAKVNALKIDEAKKKELKEKAQEVLKNSVKETYLNFLAYWLELEKKQTADNGIWAVKDGDKYYEYKLRRTTTTNLSADEIFETGVKEVARIQNEMRAIMKKVNFKSDSLQEFFEFMRTDPQFKYSNDDKGRKSLLQDCTNYLDTITNVYLDKLFEVKPKAPLKVMAVEKFREKSVAGAFYESPSEDGSRPGRFYVSLYNMNDEPNYQMEALCYHEGLPGHHMQIAIAQELTGVPKFRKYDGNTAYIEGWGLYSELVPKEIGLYQNPYSDFGRLSMEIFRAARLVVDVGIHHKKWTKQQAIDYFLKNTANAAGDIQHEIERYFLWPSQATGYKVGMLKILALREKAKKELGDKFDIRKFHTVVLTNGAVPLTVLEELVDKYIAETKAK